LLITGPPRCGKTTLIKKIGAHPSFSGKMGGFITEEIRKKGDRVGFQIITYPEGKRGVLARKGMHSPYRLGSYGVNLLDLESIGCAAVEKALSSGLIIIVDEIGKMELYSRNFREILLWALEAPQKLLATIMERKNEYADRIKERKDVRLLRLNRQTFETAFQDIVKWMSIP
jgi:nucleoside-triphosphatase